MSEATLLRLNRAQRIAVIAAVLGLALCALGWFLNHRLFFESYLLGAVFWVGTSLGCAAMVMTYHLTGGRWGDHVAGIFESGLAVLPVAAVLFIPVLLGIGSLYAWSHTDIVRSDPLLMHKARYLNVPFFVGRTVFYFVAWLVGALLLVRWGDQRRRTGDPKYGRWLATLSGPGVVIYVLTATFAGFDWVMSLEPHWYSTVYGMIFVAGQGLLAIALATVTYVMLSPAGTSLSPRHGVLYDLGNLLLMAVAFWSYVQFSQLLIIYYTNLPEEVVWYIPRMRLPWGALGVALVVLHFAVPLMLLLSRTLKQQAAALLAIAVGLMVMQFVAHVWMTSPAFGGLAWGPIGLDVAAVVGVGGVWVAVFIGQLKRRPMWAFLPAPATMGKEASHGS